jgi:hypothetical protein
LDDNVFIERLWKGGKHEDIYLKTYGSMEGVKKGLATLSCSAMIRRRSEIFGGKPLAMGYISNQPQRQVAE